MKKLFLLLVITIVSTAAIAQNEVDALRFSRSQYGGSARYWGMGGAYGAVGADFSALSTNPAGMGLYKRNEISFTPVFVGNKVASTFNGSFTDGTKSSVGIGSIGAVVVMENQKDKSNSDWKNFQFGFGYNRLANYNYNYLISGTNPKTSLLGQYVAWSNGYAPADLNDFDTKLAYNDSLVFLTNKNTNQYSADVLGVSPFPGIGQTKSVSTSGYMGETVFSGSANYQDRVYLGASLGIVSLKYEETLNFTETDNANKVPFFKSFNRYDYQLMKGTGINLKLGVIYRATDWLRLGMAFHSPTFFSKMNLEYNASMSSNFDNGFKVNANSPLWTATFDLTTPLKLIGSAAFIIGKSGLVSVDYESINYSNARFNASDYNALPNQRIREKYKSTSNVRVGGEYRFGQLSFRGGLGIFGSPYQSNINDGKGSLTTLGIGYRTSVYFVDCAFTNYTQTEDHYLYGIDSANKASLKTTNTMVMVTGGVKF
jgi:hypothetical protein